MNSLQAAIEELEQKLNEPFHGLHDGIAFALAILRKHLEDTAMVDVIKDKTTNGFSCYVCACQCDEMGLHCSATQKDLDYDNITKRPDWCPAYVTKEQ